MEHGPKMFIIYVAASSEGEAKAIGKKIVEEKLAACANVIPVMHSCYHWEGRLEETSESILLLKASAAKADEVIARVKELHSYEVPAVLAIPVPFGNLDYFDWVNSET